MIAQLTATFKSFYETDFYTLSPDEQQAKAASYLTNVLLVSCFTLSLDVIKKVFWEKKNNSVQDNVYNMLFTKIIAAPINLFFDVTPVDQIMSRFSRSMGCFQNSIIYALLHIINSWTSFCIKLAIFASVSHLSTLCCLIVSCFLIWNTLLWRSVTKHFWRMD